MIELIGGPHDGRRPRRNPDDHEIQVAKNGTVRQKERIIGSEECERYFEEGVCVVCGVRKGADGDVRRFIHSTLCGEGTCELCGKQTLTTRIGK